TNAPDEVLVGGEPEAIEALLARIGRDRAVPLGYDLAVHVPEVEEIREDWWRLHHRPTRDVGVRIYSNGAAGAYAPSAQAAADAITAQAVAPIDWPATIHRAWQDGIRVFVECGPR